MNAVLDKWHQNIEIAHDPSWLGPQSKVCRRDMCIRDLADEIERLEAENADLRAANNKWLEVYLDDTPDRDDAMLGRAVSTMEEGASLTRSGENSWVVSGFGVYYPGTTPDEALAKATNP